MQTYSKNKVKEWRQRFKRKNPWMSSFSNAKRRCLNEKHVRYPRYGGRGILFKITKEEIKQIWYRDKAMNMKQPSIDRKDNDGDYEYNNCRFIEHRMNAILGARIGSAKSARRVSQYTKYGVFIKTYKSCLGAAKETGFPRTSISISCKSNHRKAGGYRWKYTDGGQTNA